MNIWVKFHFGGAINLANVFKSGDKINEIYRFYRKKGVFRNISFEANYVYIHLMVAIAYLYQLLNLSFCHIWLGFHYAVDILWDIWRLDFLITIKYARRTSKWQIKIHWIVKGLKNTCQPFLAWNKPHENKNGWNITSEQMGKNRSKYWNVTNSYVILSIMI